MPTWVIQSVEGNVAEKKVKSPGCRRASGMRSVASYCCWAVRGSRTPSWPKTSCTRPEQSSPTRVGPAPHVGHAQVAASDGHDLRTIDAAGHDGDAACCLVAGSQGEHVTDVAVGAAAHPAV